MENESATANVAQAFGLAEIAIKLRARRIVRPFFSIGAGVLRVTTEAQPPANARAINSGLWTPIADAGVGIRIGLRGRFELAAELHAQGASNYPAIQFFGSTVARAGRPTMMGSLTLVAWL